ncbi:hypothetical protein AX17_006630 [Amanita inopinata Kibby_2008]|nr:hypothetical protein AX17_006630 [Amanita inopinata Kibby_2008]
MPTDLPIARTEPLPDPPDDDVTMKGEHVDREPEHVDVDVDSTDVEVPARCSQCACNPSQKVRGILEGTAVMLAEELEWAEVQVLVAEMEEAEVLEPVMEDELTMLREAGTWELIEPPPGVNVVGSKWVFKVKKDTAGNIVWYKARLVAQGFSQVPGVDYFDTFAPVAHLASIQVILAIAATHDLEVHQIDIKGAYLNGKLTDEETMYMRQPPGFVNQSHPRHVCHLGKIIYSLKHSGRRWYQRLCEILVDHLGFT